MLTNDALTGEVIFDYNNKAVSFEDTTPFSTLTPVVGLTEIDGILKVTGPDGLTLYEDTDYANPTINHDASTKKTGISLAAALDALGLLLNGVYKFVYNLRWVDPIENIVAIAGTDQLVVLGDWTHIQEGAQVVLAGWTDPANNVTTTVVSRTYDDTNTTFVLAATLVAESGGAGKTAVSTQFFTKTYESCLDFEIPTLDLEVTHNCTLRTLTGKDKTIRPSGDVLLTRVQTLKFPLQSSGQRVDSDIVVNDVTKAAIDVTGGLWTKQWTMLHQSTARRTLADGTKVDYLLAGTLHHDVSCNNSLQPLKNCLEKLYTEWQAACGKGNALDMAVLQITQLAKLMDICNSMGDATKASTYYEQIEAVLTDNGISCGCEDDGGEPQFLGEGATNAVQLPSTSVSSMELPWTAISQLVYSVAETDGGYTEGVLKGTDRQVPQWRKSGEDVSLEAHHLGDVLFRKLDLTASGQNIGDQEVPSGLTVNTGDGVLVEGRMEGSAGAAIELSIGATQPTISPIATFDQACDNYEGNFVLHMVRTNANTVQCTLYIFSESGAPDDILLQADLQIAGDADLADGWWFRLVKNNAIFKNVTVKIQRPV